MLDDEIAVEESKAEIKALDNPRNELEAQLNAADEPPPFLHPEIAGVYRAKVRKLTRALEQPEGKGRPPRRCAASWAQSC